MTLAAGPALARLVMGVSSGKFSVTRLTVTTVLTTTEVITAPSAERLYKIGAHKIMIKIPCPVAVQTYFTGILSDPY